MILKIIVIATLITFLSASNFCYIKGKFPDGNEYEVDLSPLANHRAFFVTEDSSFKYFVNICGGKVLPKCEHEYAIVQQSKNSSQCKPLGSPDLFSLRFKDLKNVNAGVTLHYTLRSTFTEIYFICDPTQLGELKFIKSKEHMMSHEYFFQWRTKFACGIKLEKVRPIYQSPLCIKGEFTGIPGVPKQMELAVDLEKMKVRTTFSANQQMDTTIGVYNYEPIGMYRIKGTKNDIQCTKSFGRPLYRPESFFDPCKDGKFVKLLVMHGKLVEHWKECTFLEDAVGAEFFIDSFSKKPLLINLKQLYASIKIKTFKENAKIKNEYFTPPIDKLDCEQIP